MDIVLHVVQCFAPIISFLVAMCTYNLLSRKRRWVKLVDAKNKELEKLNDKYQDILNKEFDSIDRLGG